MKKFYQLTNKSFSTHKVKNYKDLWEKVKGEYTGFCVGVTAEFKQKAENENKFHVIMSTATEDRHGDIVEQEFSLKAFKKNPVFLDSHNYSSIEHILGKVEKAKVEAKKLQGDIVYMLDNPKGMLGYQMTIQKFLNAVSIGFIPKEFDDKGKILKSELLELSAVSVPANAEALFEKIMKGKKKKKKVEPKVEKQEVVTKENVKLKALKNIVRKKEVKRIKLLKEAVGAMKSLAEKGVEASEKRTMANRAIRKIMQSKHLI